MDTPQNPQGPVKHKAPEPINMQEVIGLTARLARLLAEEVDMLGAMKLNRIRDLQEEKQFLLHALETHRRTLQRHPHLSESIPSRDKKDLEAVVKVFENILQENHRRLLMAREVNHKVVEAITEAVKDTAVSRVYNGAGNAGALGSDRVCISLNQTA